MSKNHPINLEWDNNKLLKQQNKNQNRPFKTILQLDRIVDSIIQFVKYNDIEVIKPFYFAPWQKSIPYTINISKSSKDEATKEHLALINSTKNALNIYNIYSDASQLPKSITQGIGIGLAVLKQNRLIYQKMINIGHSQIVYNGELQGVIEAIKYAINKAKKGDIFRIFSDNQAGLYRLKTPSDNPGQNHQIDAFILTKQLQAKRAKIDIYWSPGHFDIPGNELADKLTKRATFINPIFEETSFVVIGLKIKELRRTKWSNYLKPTKSTKPTNYSKRFYWNIKSKISVPPDTKRELASAFYQLKFGHGYIKSYLYRLGHIGTNRCICGLIKTPEHLLLNCKEIKKVKKKV